MDSDSQVSPDIFSASSRKEGKPTTAAVPVMIFSLLSLLILLPRSAWCAVGDIVHEIPRCGHGWFGGVAWCNGYIYESCKGGSPGWAEIFKKDPVSGEVMQVLRTPVVASTYVNGIAYDSKRQCFWLAVGSEGIYQVGLEGGDPLSHFKPFKRPYGMYYEAETDRLWISDSAKGRIKKFDPDTHQELETIYLDFLPTGIERVGNYLWIAESGDDTVGAPATVYKCHLDGTKTGVSFLLPTGEGYWSDVGGIAFDGRDLWVKGGAHTAIYQVDIGEEPPASPSPVPLPTPFLAVIGSGDFNGDGTADLAVFRLRSGLWTVRDLTRFYFGYLGDIPLPGDYDGDGTADPGFFRKGSGLWGVRSVTRVYFAAGAGIPVTGDYDGNGCHDMGIFEAERGLWFLRGISRFYLGAGGDCPVRGDFNGDATTEVGVFRPRRGQWVIRGITSLYFGKSGDITLPGDYLGNGTEMMVIFRPASGLWASSSGHRVYFGSSGDQPVPVNYKGNSVDYLGIFCGETSRWSVRGLTKVYFGTTGDIPATR